MSLQDHQFRVHRWDSNAFAKALIISLAVESISMAPLVIWGYGHAGAGSVPGWFGLMFNLPGFLLVGALADALNFSQAGLFVAVFLAQTTLLCYVMFICFRIRNVRS